MNKKKKKKTQDKSSPTDPEQDSEDPSLDENFNHKEPSYSEVPSPFRVAILYEDSIRVKLDSSINIALNYYRSYISDITVSNSNFQRYLMMTLLSVILVSVEDAL